MSVSFFPFPCGPADLFGCDMKTMRAYGHGLNGLGVTRSQRERMAVQYKTTSVNLRSDARHRLAPNDEMASGQFFSGFGRRSCAPGTPVRRADVVERHQFGIEWIRCPGTTRVMRVAKLGVRPLADFGPLSGKVSREYPPSRDGVERHARTRPVGRRGVSTDAR